MSNTDKFQPLENKGKKVKIPIDFASFLAAMRALGVTWCKGHAIPTYPPTITQQQKDQADTLYDSMSEEFIDTHWKTPAQRKED